MKFLAIVPLYRPCPAKIYNLFSFLASCDIDVLFYDNSNCQELVFNLLNAFSGNFKIIGTGENHGTAKAYNAAVSYLLSSKDYSHLCIFDQDSEPASDYFSILRALDPQITHRNIVSPFDRRNIYRFIDKRNLHSSYRFLYQAKASGMVIPRSLFELGHSFNEFLFVDYVDWLFCWQASSYEFPVIEVSYLKFNHHALGDPYLLLGLFTRNFPALSRRRIQSKSAIYLMSNILFFKNAPLNSIVRIIFRPLVNSILNLFQMFGLLVPQGSN